MATALATSPSPAAPRAFRPALKWIGRGLAALWAAFWVWFGAASAIGEGLTILPALGHVALPGLVFAVFAALAWWRPWVGAPLLIGAGAVVAVGYPIWASHMSTSIIAFVELTMALPPLLAGALLLPWRRRAITPAA